MRDLACNALAPNLWRITGHRSYLVLHDLTGYQVRMFLPDSMTWMYVATWSTLSVARDAVDLLEVAELEAAMGATQ